MPRRGSRPSPAIVVAITALLVAIGTSTIAAVAAIPQDGRFTACYQTSPDILNRIVLFAEPNEACPDSYARVTWSQAGGAQGPAGAPGPQGPQGPAGPAADSTSLRLSVTQRKITLRTEEPAIVRCPSFSRALSGGGAVVNAHAYEIDGSHPVVRNSVPIGWAFTFKSQRRFKIVPSTLDSTRLWDGLPRHRHNFYQPLHVQILEPNYPSRTPVQMLVYVVCLRDPLPLPGGRVEVIRGG